MALLTASFTTPSIESINQKQVIDRFLRESGLGQSGTATGGSTTTLVDTTRLQSTQYASNTFTNYWVRHSYRAASPGAAPEGSIRPATGYTNSSGTVAFSPSMTTGFVSGDGYQLIPFPHPQDLLDHLDTVLAEDCYVPEFTLCTEVPDGDMEQNNTTDWTATNATVTKATAEPTMSGKRYLSVAATSAGGSADSANIRVRPGHSYMLSAMVRANAASTTARLTAYDATNSAVIDSRDTTSQANVRVFFQFTAPATCHLVKVRLACVENSVTTLWDDVALWCIESNDIALPWWVRNRDQVKGIFRPVWHTGGDNSSYDPAPNAIRDSGRWDFVPDDFGRGQMRLVSRRGSINEHVYILGTRNETAFASSTTDTKRVDANWVQAALGRRVFQQLVRLPANTTYDSKWLQAIRDEYLRDYERLRRAQETRLERFFQASSPGVLIGGEMDDSLRPGRPTRA